MKKNFFFTLLYGALLFGCRTTDQQNQTQSASSSSATDESCTSMGGTVVTLGRCTSAAQCDNAAKDQAVAAALKPEKFCNLDRTWIRFETLQQALQGKGGLAITKYLTRSRFEPNSHINQPADYYCTLPEVGGSLALYYSPHASGAMCEFKDGTCIGDWTLYYGSGSDAPAGYQKFIKILHDMQK